MKLPKYLPMSLALVMGASALAALSPQVQQKLDSASARLERGDAAGALQVLEPIFKSGARDERFAAGLKMLEILAPPTTPTSRANRARALQIAESLLATPNLSPEEEAEARLQQARLLYARGEGDAEQSARAYESLLDWAGAPSAAIVRAVENARFPLGALVAWQRLSALLDKAIAHPNLATPDKIHLLLERASREGGGAPEQAERRHALVQRAYELSRTPGVPLSQRLPAISSWAYEQDDPARARALFEEAVQAAPAGDERAQALRAIGQSYAKQQQWAELQLWIESSTARLQLSPDERAALLGLKLQVLEAPRPGAPDASAPNAPASQSRAVREELARAGGESGERVEALLALGHEDALGHPEQSRQWFAALLGIRNLSPRTGEEAEDGVLASYKDAELSQAREWLRAQAAARAISTYDASRVGVLLAARLEAAGQSDEATRAYMEAALSRPNIGLVRNQAQQALERLLPQAVAQKNWSLATEGYNALLKTGAFEDEQTMWRLRLSEIYAAQGDAKSRLAQLQIIEALGPKHTSWQAHFEAAMAWAAWHLEAKQPAKARAKLMEAAQEFPYVKEGSEAAWWRALREVDVAQGRGAAAAWIARIVGRGQRDEAALRQEYTQRFGK